MPLFCLPHHCAVLFHVFSPWKAFHQSLQRRQMFSTFCKPPWVFDLSCFPPSDKLFLRFPYPLSAIPGLKSRHGQQKRLSKNTTTKPILLRVPIFLERSVPSSTSKLALGVAVARLARGGSRLSHRSHLRKSTFSCTTIFLVTWKVFLICTTSNQL